MSRPVILLCVLVGACASSPQPETSAAPAPAPAFRTTEAPDPAPLTSVDIPPGRCGMILWARSGGRTVPVFRTVDVIEATMTVEGERTDLRLASQDGELRLGMRSRQLFLPADQSSGLSVAANLEWGQPFPSGTYVSGGTLVLTGEDGWQRILPVAGIAGCKA